jgi:hypothetical protein
MAVAAIQRSFCERPPSFPAFRNRATNLPHIEAVSKSTPQTLRFLICG